VSLFKKDNDDPKIHTLAKSILGSIAAWGATILVEKLYDYYLEEHKRNKTTLELKEHNA